MLINTTKYGKYIKSVFLKGEMVRTTATQKQSDR